MKQDPFSGVYRALSPKELAEMFMNPNAPKTEAEHWAVREIEKQRAEIERLRADLATQQGCCDGAAAQDAHICREREEHKAEIERLRAENERLSERLLQERAALVLDEIFAALERERVLRAALTDMLSGWRYIRDTYGDLARVGWDRVEQKARKALEAKP